MWADRFDGNVADVFGVQDAFVAKIVEALKVNLTGNEKTEITRGRTDSLRAKEAFDEGWSLSTFVSMPRTTRRPSRRSKRAIQLDPEYGRAYAALALVYFRVEDYALARGGPLQR
ncbi:hypothetical protein HFO61_10340 [Rhizobium leguminosarum]|uniref:hypothetical protein n=1 Tax=Rhizobium leguminosarum TaxID=384 RepID=UPI001C972FC3|nr:hypothetical protein [Rhizobium leguminosarum]MBY5547214.1 hypothetical protein [Rhizobium leguminosarum]